MKKLTKFNLSDICVNPQNFINKFIFYKSGNCFYVKFIYKIDYCSNKIYYFMKTIVIKKEIEIYYEFENQDDSDLLYLEILKIKGFVF